MKSIFSQGKYMGFNMQTMSNNNSKFITKMPWKVTGIKVDTPSHSDGRL
jgi:hypothetical protein